MYLVSEIFSKYDKVDKSNCEGNMLASGYRAPKNETLASLADCFSGCIFKPECVAAVVHNDSRYGSLFCDQKTKCEKPYKSSSEHTTFIRSKIKNY